MAAASESSCRSIKESTRCTTVTYIPCCLRALAASRPSRPPPITNACLCFPEISSIVCTSRMLRKVTTPPRSLPGTGRTIGWEPVASNSRSYPSVIPCAAITRRLFRSILTTVLSVWRVIPFSAYHCSSLSIISSRFFSPANTGDRRIRL